MIQKIKELLFALTHPSFWIQNHPFNKEWEDEFNKLMLNHKFEQIGEFTAKLGNKTIWISNYPYASFSDHDFETIYKYLPKRLTRYKAMKKLEEDFRNSLTRAKSSV
jgi:hypothetical protein